MDTSFDYSDDLWRSSNYRVVTAAAEREALGNDIGRDLRYYELMDSEPFFCFEPDDYFKEQATYINELLNMGPLDPCDFMLLETQERLERLQSLRSWRKNFNARRLTAVQLLRNKAARSALRQKKKVSTTWTGRSSFRPSTSVVSELPRQTLLSRRQQILNLLSW